MRTVYEEVKVTAAKTASCPVCGKRTRRSKTFGQTINPFNRTASGDVKTRRIIQRELEAAALQWKQDPDGSHDRCRLASAATQ